MDATRFDRLVLTLTRARTRRSVLGVLSALGLTSLAARDVLAVCVANGRRCLRGSDCCSGRCKRKRGTRQKFCRQVPDQGICTTESNHCTFTTTVCNPTGAIPACWCFVTTQGFSFCGQQGSTCFECQTDADCQKRTGGQPGERCVECIGQCGPGAPDHICVRTCPNPV